MRRPSGAGRGFRRKRPADEGFDANRGVIRRVGVMHVITVIGLTDRRRRLLNDKRADL